MFFSYSVLHSFQYCTTALLRQRRGNKWLYTRNDKKELPNLCAAVDNLILPPAKDKKGFATGVTDSRIKLPMAARSCKPGRWYGTSCRTH